jgi:hypothetical protein
MRNKIGTFTFHWLPYNNPFVVFYTSVYTSDMFDNAWWRSKLSQSKAITTTGNCVCPNLLIKQSCSQILELDYNFFFRLKSALYDFAYNSGILIYWWPKSLTAETNLLCNPHGCFFFRPNKFDGHALDFYLVSARFEFRRRHLPFSVFSWHFSIIPDTYWVSTWIMARQLSASPLQFVSQPIILHCVDQICTRFLHACIALCKCADWFDEPAPPTIP